MSPRQRNHGLRKVCGCRRANWPKCLHAWYINYTWRGELHRFSLDRELGRHIDNKTDAEHEADRIRLEIRAGTFHRRDDPSSVPPRAAADSAVTVDTFAPVYIERVSRASRKRSWANDAGMFVRLRDYRASDGRRLGEWALRAITEDALEAFYTSLSAFAASTRNQYVQLLKASFRWAAKKGYLDRSPISED